MQAGRWQKNFHQADFRKQDYLFFGLNIKNLLSDPSPSIRKLASVIGSLIYLFPAIPFGKLRNQNFEKRNNSIFKKGSSGFWSKSMHKHFCNVRIEMVVPYHPKCYLYNINIPQVNFAINTDANKPKWEATDGVTLIGGIGSTPDKANHINILELLAIKHTLVNYRKI